MAQRQPSHTRRSTDVPEYDITAHTGIKVELKDVYTIIVVAFGLASVWFGLNSRVEKLEEHLKQVQVSDTRFQEIPPRVSRLEDNDKRQDEQLLKINTKLDDIKTNIDSQFKSMEVHFRDLELKIMNNNQSRK